MKDKMEYYYDEQFRKVLVQFLAFFTYLKVKSGKTNELDGRFIDVQIKSGSSDRVVAAIKAKNTQNAPVRLPLAAGRIAGYEMANDLKKGLHVERTVNTFPSGGIFPQDIKTIKQYMPIPYRVNLELNIYASSQEQHLEIMEQILILFDPTVELYTSDEIFDMTRMKSLTLVGIDYDDAIPGTDKRIIRTTLSFQAPVYLAVPTEVYQNYISEIKLRVGAVNSLANGLDELDQDGVEYETLVKLKDIDIDV